MKQYLNLLPAPPGGIIGRWMLIVVLIFCMVQLLQLTPVHRASALATTPTTMNFQGRLTNSSGNIMADGLYNMKFRLYDAASAGTLKWSEIRETTNRVQVTNGLFSVQLGQVTPLDPTIFASGSLYFEIELPTPATATCTTASCGTFTEGPMTPRNKLSTSAYAYNAETLDGLDSTDFIRNSTSSRSGNIAIQSAAAGNVGFQMRAATSQTADLAQFQDAAGNSQLVIDRFGRLAFGSLTAINGAGISLQTTDVAQQGLVARGLNGQTADLFDAQDYLGNNYFSVAGNGNTTVKNTSTSAFQIQNAGGTALLAVDTSGGTVTVGSATNGVVLSANGLIYAGTARPSKTITLTPEYAGAVFTGDGTTNVGTLTSDFCSGSAAGGISINAAACGGATATTRNYYNWTTTQASAQNYDIWIRYQMPSDYDLGSMTNLKILAWGDTTTSESATVALYVDGTTAACSTSTNAVTANATWSSATTASPLGSCTINAGDMVTLRVRVVAGQNKNVRASAISFNYRGKF